jgi:hypothetical protein
MIVGDGHPCADHQRTEIGIGAVAGGATPAIGKARLLGVSVFALLLLPVLVALRVWSLGRGSMAPGAA